MLIIVSAEDLGTESALNDEIFALIELKTVTSATVIANGPAFAQAAKAIAQFPECSFGVHLNLTVFPPLRPSPQLAANSGRERLTLAEALQNADNATAATRRFR